MEQSERRVQVMDIRREEGGEGGERMFDSESLPNKMLRKHMLPLRWHLFLKMETRD